jgi:site-specific DNA-methyltransferase (adenine-specific)
MKPYYEHGGITIYHGDCREVLPQIAAHFMITDPPFGLEIGTANNQDRGSGYGGHLAKGAYATYVDSYENFVGLIVPRLNEWIDKIGRAAVFTGPHIHEQRKPAAIGGIWHRAATGRTTWGTKNFLPILFYGTPPNAGQHRPLVYPSHANSEQNGHPCPKPIEWIHWLITLGAKDGEIIVDPFTGSGTILQAAKELLNPAIGIEIEERYCEIAAKRLAQEVMDFA